MKQSRLDLNLSVKKTRKGEFLFEMDLVVPWVALVELIAPYYPEGRQGKPPFPLETTLRVHFMQQWFTLSDPRCKRPSWTCRCTASLPGSMRMGACLTRAPFCGFVTG